MKPITGLVTLLVTIEPATPKVTMAIEPSTPPLANRGTDFRVIQDYLGHRDPRHTTRYTRTSAHRFEGLWD